MRRRLAALVLVLLVGVAAYLFVFRDQRVAPAVASPRPAATIGEGEEAVVVSADGAVVRWLPIPEEPPLPTLSLDEPPQGGRLAGPVLEQARALGAVPDQLRPYLARGSQDETGVEVELSTGIELIFGNDSQLARKWKAAAAVLANPEITVLDYVDLRAPSRPSYGGSGHELPPAP